mgnify:CR=1 FL=1
MKKRLFALMLTLIMILCFYGCKDKEANKPQESTTSVSDKNTQKQKSNKETDAPTSEVAQTDTSITTDETPTEETTGIPTAEVTEKKVILKNFSPICQYPELPTGCEMTSLTMVLNFYGVSADKCDISDNYLEKGAVGTVDFRKAFVGDPRDESSYGCYAPVVANTANKYLQVVGAEYKATDITGTTLEKLFSYIDNNTPVIIWATQYMREGHQSVTWNIDGKDLTWITPEHCMVLVGYSDNYVFIADPLFGEVKSYGKTTFNNRYQTLYSQAVIIQ